MPFVLGFWVISFTLLGLYPTLFQLPTLGNPALILFGSFIFLLTTGLMAGACSFIFRDRERVMLYVSFFSVGLIFVSGMSYPLHQIPWFWSRVFYYIFPSSPFIKFFIKTNSMGASYNLVLNELLILVAQATVYFSIAVFVYRRRKITLIKDLSL
jgi:ABC-2 type transporter.